MPSPDPATVAPSLFPNRLDWIDSLRSLAVLMVVFHHFTPYKSILDLFNFGRAGVLLFFMVSGYCIAFTLEKPARRPVTEFWIRRLLRLYPAYWVTVIILFIADRLDIFVYAQQDTPLWIWAVNLTMLQEGLRVPDVSGIFWTLYFELLFYGLISVLIPWGGTRRRGFLLAGWVGLLLLALAFAWGRTRLGLPLPFSYPLFMATFLTGTLVNRLDRDGRFLSVAAYLAWSAAALGGVGLISWVYFQGGSIAGETWISHWGNFIVAGGTFLIFGRFAHIRTPILVRIGKLCFSLYLLHSIAYWCLEDLLGQSPLPALALPLALALALALSFLMHRWVEQPAIALARRLVLRLDQR